MIESSIIENQRSCEMNWPEDFEDVPSVEERMPNGLSPIEMSLVREEADYAKCECCGERLLIEALTRTDLYEYCTMDLDPDTLLCGDCYEDIRLQHVPSDPMLWDALTPVAAD